MSSFLQPPGGNRPATGTTTTGGGGFLQGPSSSSTLQPRQTGGSSPFTAPILPRAAVTTPVQQNTLSNTPALSDLALGRASQLLDAVRDRKVDWKQAKPFLDVLSSDDKKALASVRGDMNEDEKRALGMSEGGGGSVFNKVWGGVVDYTPLGVMNKYNKAVLGKVGLGTDPVTGTASNLMTDIDTFVKDMPAGLVKAGISVGKDVKKVIEDPLAPSSRGPLLGGTGKSETQKQILDPTIQNYADTYGPIFRGDPMKTAHKIQDHPLGPLLDVFAVASFGASAASKSIAASNWLKTMKYSKESPTQGRMGTYDTTNETYQPLGYNMQHYVRPTTQQIHAEPWSSHFSVLVDPETGEALFSPIGSSHDEIYQPLIDKRNNGDSKPYRKWMENPNIIQATGIFDPRTGKVGSINMWEDDLTGHGAAASDQPFPWAHVDEIAKLRASVMKQAQDVYITKKQYDGMAKENRADTILIKQDPGERYDPHTGEQLPPTWHVQMGKNRIQANFPSEDAAVAYAQSLRSGGVNGFELAKEMQSYVQMTGHQLNPEPFGIAGELQPAHIPAPGPVRRRSIVTGKVVSSTFSGTGRKGAAAETPVPEGHVRVYRGQGTGNAPQNVPDWMQSNQGLWFTTRRSTAEHYAGDGGVSYVDVPRETLQQLRVEGGSGAPEYILPREMADAAQAVEGKASLGKLLSSPLRPTTRVEPLVPTTKLQGAMGAFRNQHVSLLDLYEQVRQISHTREWENILEEVVGKILTNPEANMKKATIAEAIQAAVKQVGEDLSATKRADFGRYAQRIGDQPEFMSQGLSASMGAVGITAREVSDIIRAGAVFLRPAYIPNNWAGNAFLNVIHAGMYAPMNLGKSLVMDKHLGVLYTRGIDQSMGYNPASVMMTEHGAGYSAAFTNPVAKLMGSIGDQPFRRAAWLHEARRSGYVTLRDVQRLWDKAFAERTKFEERYGIGKADLPEGEMPVWDPKKTPALAEVAKISRAAQEEIIKFGKYNDIESSVLRNLIFVYSWMRGAGRYFGRFPMQHPIQAAAYMNLANVGQNWLNQELGGVPSFLIGAIPVGKDDQGNTKLINPFSVNPLGTGQQLVSAAASFKEMLTHPDEFNKYSQTDPISLLNPLVQTGIEAYTGGRPVTESIPDTIAALRLKGNLEHPGRGQVYPTSRGEAIGQFSLGSMFPRQSSQAAISRSLQRERSDQPELRIDDEVAAFEKATGGTVPQDLIDLYKQDLVNLEKVKDFQHDYAHDHGSQGFDNMPAKNRAEAALKYLTKNNLMAPVDAINLQKSISELTNDDQMNILANALWRQTGAGRVKDKWDELIHGARDQTNLTPERP